MGKEGLLLCAKYAASPNFFGYCGPLESSNLVDHLKENIADKDLTHLLCEFETLYPYLKLISHENKIEDPFDKKVVEAYWLGNSLLKNIPNRDYFYFLTEKLSLEKKLNKQHFQKIKEKILSYPFLPHHSFHVFNIFKRTGRDPSFHTLETMDQCRIGWGKVKEIKNEKLKMKNSLLIGTRPLSVSDGSLVLANPSLKKIKLDYRGKKYLNNLMVGDWVSFHWGFVCDVLSEDQVKNLGYYTQRSIEFFNSPCL